jgi:hypothetical protein
LDRLHQNGRYVHGGSGTDEEVWYPEGRRWLPLHPAAAGERRVTTRADMAIVGIARQQ